MKRKSILILAAALLAAVFSFDACKQADIATNTLTVLVSQGVSGIPAAGIYELENGSSLQYSFTLNAGYSKLTVLVDGAAVAASGTLVISKDQKLQAYADDLFQYGLSVTLTDGVTGTPGAGVHSYAPGSPVDYSYGLVDGYYDLVVMLDNEAVAASGTLTMSGDHKLSVSAKAGKKIQGSWLLSEMYDDDSSFNVTVTFSGKYAEGTVTDSDGGSGTYTFVAGKVVFNLVFPDVTYEYSGTFGDNDKMSGTCKRYQVADNVIGGIWMATRKTGAPAAALRQAAAGNPAGKDEPLRGDKK
jgi:hypothetical protein